MALIGGLLLAACGSSALFILFKAARRRTAIYRYDVRTDQRYEFPPSSTCVDGRLVAGRLDVPAFAKGGVVLLELRIRATLLGHWFEPRIELRSSRGQWRQPIERGGAGLRVVDLSALLAGHAHLDGPCPLRLRGRHLNLPDQTVVLRHLPQDLDLDRQKILVLATHPDDAEIAAFGVYAGRDAYVVTITAGEAGEAGTFERFGGADAFREKGRNRAWNSVAVPMLGGLSINRTVNLGYFDGTLAAMRDRPDVTAQSLQSGAEYLDVFGFSQDPNLIASRSQRPATWNGLVADLEHLLKSIRPDILVAPYPRLDAHPDHKMSTIALIEALKNQNVRRGSLLLYTNHSSSSDRYPFGDAGDLVSLPHGIDEIFFDGLFSNPLSGALQARKYMALEAMIDLRPNVRTDSLRSTLKAFKHALTSWVGDDQTSYFRQAVRANELFFEVRVSSLYEPGVIARLID
jgi:LmbE family N-acetylglucosaminyl deacetylase